MLPEYGTYQNTEPHRQGRCFPLHASHTSRPRYVNTELVASALNSKKLDPRL